MPRTPSDHAAGSGDPLLGAVVAGKYRVVDLMARGGMGRIYRAEQLPLGREVALKILTRPMLGSTTDDIALEKRFLLEAATCARLRHPNTVSVYDYGSIEVGGDPTFYIVMELIRGRTLAQVLRAEGAFPPTRAARIAYEITRSLREAHAEGVVHRDLKPSNVMLVETDEGESVKVLDFGVAKVLAAEAESLTTDGSFVGSPRYTAPEQIRQQVVDGRSDLYALGICLWEMVTGAAPFSSPEPMRTLLMQLNDPLPAFAPRFSVPPGLEALIRRLLEKQPQDRVEDADALLGLLRPFRGGEAADNTLEVVLPADTVTQPDNGGTLPPKLGSGRSMALAAVGLLGVLLVALTVVGVGGWWVTQLAGRGGAPGGGSGPPQEGGVVGSAGAASGAPSAGAVAPAVAGPVVRIESEPSGAQVLVGGQAVGSTPFDLEFASPSAAPVAVELQRSGYKRKSVAVDGADPDGVVSVALERVEVKKPPPPPPPGDGLRMER